MSTVNATNYKIDQTVRIFDKFYEYETEVPANEYEIVISYFKSIMPAPTAENFAISLFRVAENNSVPVLSLLQELQGQDSMNLNVTMAYYLNSLRSPATLLGITAPVAPSIYTARNVLI